MSATFITALTLAIVDLTSVRPVDTDKVILYAHSKPTKWNWATKWAKLIEKVSKEEGEDAFLVSALVSRESGFDPNKVNPTTGALGLLQIMPGSADHVLLGWKKARTASVPIEKVMVPATNLRVGIRILKRFKQLCEGDLVKALSAFGGMGCIDSEYGREVERRWLRARRFYRPIS